MAATKIPVPSQSDAGAQSADLPRICVCIPALNEEKYILETLKSLKAQQYPRDLYEIVVAVDSKNSDGTRAICEREGVRVVEDDRHHTPGGALNIGFEGSSADIYACTHADTAVAPDWLTQIARNLGPGGEYDAVHGPLIPKADSQAWVPLAYWAMNNLYRFLGFVFRRAYFAGPNHAMRRQTFTDLGGYNPAVVAAEDNELSIRISRAHYRWRFDPALKVYTSDRRLRQGLLLCIWRYGKLFLFINFGRKPWRFKPVR